MNQTSNPPDALAHLLLPHFEALYDSLRGEYPYATNDALHQIVDNSRAELGRGMEKETQHMSERKARFNFFKLPAEIRCTIYDLALPEPRERSVQGADIVRHPNQGQDAFQIGYDYRRELLPPAAAHVCRQMRADILPIFYGSNTFTVTIDAMDISDHCHPNCKHRDQTAKTAREWLTLIGKERASLIKHLLIKIPMPPDDCTVDHSCREEGGELCDGWHPQTPLDVARQFRMHRYGVPTGSFEVAFGTKFTNWYSQGHTNVTHCKEEIEDDWHYGLAYEMEWTPMPKHTTASPFMDLPAELRNRIYTLAMPVDRKYVVQPASVFNDEAYRSFDFGKQEYRRVRLVPPPVTQVSHQAREESLPIFYGLNTFIAYVDISYGPPSDYVYGDEPDTQTLKLREWLKNVGWKAAHLIKNLVIRMPLPPDKCTWKGHGRHCAHSPSGCHAWAPQSSVDVAKAMRLLGSGVPLSSFQAQFGVTINGHEWESTAGYDLLHRGRERDIEFAPMADSDGDSKVEVTEEDLDWPIWDEEFDVYQDRDRPKKVY